MRKMMDSMLKIMEAVFKQLASWQVSATEKTKSYISRSSHCIDCWPHRVWSSRAADGNVLIKGVVSNLLIPGRLVTIPLFVMALFVAGSLHGINMFSYPYFEGDEGTYMSQAWAVVKQGTLAPYTYWYDHAPGGWYAIALFVQMLGGDFFFFGSSNDTGRVFMWVVHMLSAALIFYITKRIAHNSWLAVMGVLLFSISPLEIYFQRRVLLDNIMIFWLLAATAILLSRREHIWNFVLSGAFFAIAILTKITAILFIPAALLFVHSGSHQVSRSFRTTLFLSAMIMTYSLFPLYASIKGELLPEEGKVSVVSAFIFQMSRGGGGVPFWDDASMFMQVVYDWIIKDQNFVIISATILSLSLIVAFFQKRIALVALGPILYLLFLARGGVVLNFYVLPLIAAIAILGPTLASSVATYLGRRADSMRGVFGIAAIVALFVLYADHAEQPVFAADETSQQRRAVHWIKDNLSEEDVIVSDNYALVDLWDPDYYNGKSFPNAHWFYKVEKDPEIRSLFQEEWRDVDFLLVNHELIREIERGDAPLIQEALTNATPVAKWLPVDDKSFVDEQKFISTNGDWAMVYAVNRETKTTLLSSWERYKEAFIRSYGQVIDPDSGVTTSEGQSYAMLQAAWMNDREMFKGLWLWTQHHLQNRIGDKLFSWKWENDALSDSTNASDADQDIALALLFGYRMFGEDAYLRAAQEIVRDIWKQEVEEINGRLYLLPMNRGSAMRPSGYLFNPSYISPAWYRIFAEVDAQHDWERLAKDSYTTLSEIARRSTNMPLSLNWYEVNSDTGVLVPARDTFGTYAATYSYDAFRLLWRVAMDDEWFQAPEAKEYLARIGDMVSRMYERYDRLPTVIDSGGNPVSWETSQAVATGYLSVFRSIQNSDLESRYFRDSFIRSYDPLRRTWGSGNYYDSSWSWLGVGLYHGDLFNLWKLRLFDQ
jgi:endo-1,4-beta-D-glucanase Y/4-amino-4-deoxy-L-arabinose transferase-like glycosyltransferase